jgi:capsular polysaccharide biosynthesis protein
MAPHRTFALALSLIVLAIAGASASDTKPKADERTEEYNQLCDGMVQGAIEASKLHNEGKKDAAEEKMASVRDLYAKAIAINPSEPQAHLNLAIFLSNTHQFEEALEKFEETKKYLGGQINFLKMVDQRMRKAKLGLYSKNRDEAYLEGKGDVRQGLSWAKKQLTVSDAPMVVQHEIATMKALLCEYDEELCTEAMQDFQTATTLSMHGFARRMPLKCKKDDSRLLLRWSEHPSVTTDVLVKPNAEKDVLGVYLHHVEKGIIIGRDGIVMPQIIPPLSSTDEVECSLLSPATDFYLNVAQNVLRKPFDRESETKLGRPMVRQVDVLSLVQFAGTAFYHWMCEAVPRLVAAKTFLRENPNVKILVPKTVKFIDRTLEMFAEEFGIPDDRLIYHDPPYYFHYKYIHFVQWDPVVKPHRPATTALAHPGALAAARDTFRATLAANATVGKVDEEVPAKYIVFAGRGSGTSMRNFDETKVIAALQSELAEKHPDVKLVHVTNAHTFEQALRLFAGAVGVVGAHGGALSNLMACKAGTFVVEIGFKGDATQHYAHVSESLGLAYINVHVAADALGRSMGAPEISFDQVEVVKAVLAGVSAAPREEL